MKRFLICLAALVLLAACLIVPPMLRESRPPADWVASMAQPWDREGALVELPLNVPNGTHYSSAMEFDGDLLLWDVDNHLQDVCTLELCLVELDDGTVAAHTSLQFASYVLPQSLEGSLFLCDGVGGSITALDRSLTVVDSWSIEPVNGELYMGFGEKLYIYEDYRSLSVMDLTTGETQPVLSVDSAVEYISRSGDVLTVEYYRPDTGASACAAVELRTGAVQELGLTNSFGLASCRDSNWLLSTYQDAYTYRLCTADADPVQFSAGEQTIQLLEGERMLATDGETRCLTLYDLEGTSIARCQLSEIEYNIYLHTLIYSPGYGGYFCPVSDMEGSLRLLFWDLSCSPLGTDLQVSPVPKPSETQQLLDQRAQALGEKYGLIVYVGENCQTEFDEFSATLATDPNAVNAALDVLDRAFSAYPEGFIRQLRSGARHSIRIHLISDLQADGSDRYGGGYSAFTQANWDHYLMVVDIGDSSEQTYYHEMSHIIDSYLWEDATARPDALFSEQAWAQNNPDWFTDYSFDYSVEHSLWDNTSFVDSYATISPTEDRARVMEFAMVPHGAWAFKEGSVLYQKLSYYCRCIRDAFDTTGWPEILPWEQYLS